MAVIFNKPRGMKYTDMCIYVDAHFPEVKVPNQNPDVESKIFEYLYHIIYALSCKAGYFKNFEDYDKFACYGATEVFISMRKKLINEGQTIRGKVVVPVKSCLNFIKATLYPLRVNYQRENFTSVLDPAIDKQLIGIDYDARENIQVQYRSDFLDAYSDASKQIPRFISLVLDTTCFKKNEAMRRKLFVSILLTLLNDVTLPNKAKEKLKVKKEKEDFTFDKLMIKLNNIYEQNHDAVIVWHLDSRFSNYIRYLTAKVKSEFSKELQYYLHGDDLSDELLDDIIYHAYDNYEEPEETY